MLQLPGFDLVLLVGLPRSPLHRCLISAADTTLSRNGNPSTSVSCASSSPPLSHRDGVLVRHGRQGHSATLPSPQTGKVCPWQALWLPFDCQHTPFRLPPSVLPPWSHPIWVQIGRPNRSARRRPLRGCRFQGTYVLRFICKHERTLPGLLC